MGACWRLASEFENSRFSDEPVAKATQICFVLFYICPARISLTSQVLRLHNLFGKRISIQQKSKKPRNLISPVNELG